MNDARLHSETPAEAKVALASPPQAGAIAVIQLCGPQAPGVLEPFFSAPLPRSPGAIRRGYFCDRNRQVVDQVLVARMSGAGDGYEITCHGGVRIFQRIIDTLIRAGARLVAPDELLDVAFGLDNPVARAAYRLLIDARTTLAVRFLLHQAHGGLREVLEGGDPDSRRRALTYWPAVEYLLKGLKIALTGPSNAGKSTLLNALSATPHALVADLPGTTRDYVQAPVDLDGLPAELIDTAGLGPTTDPLGVESQRRTREQVQTADCAFLVLDAARRNESRDFAREFHRCFSPPRVVVLINKIDSPRRQLRMTDLALPGSWPVVEISARRNVNLEKIPPLVQRLVGLEGFDYRRPTAFTPELADRCRR